MLPGADDHPLLDPSRPHAVTGKTLYGRTPGVSLDDRGRAQAATLADRLASVRLTAVYSSPLDRCMETMAPLAARQRLEVVARERLIEMDVGAWTGRSLAQVRRTRLWKRCPSITRRSSASPTASRSSRRSARTDRDAGTRRASSDAGAIAVGSHGDIIRMLVAHFAGAHLDLFQRTTADPASVSVVISARAARTSSW